MWQRQIIWLGRFKDISHKMFWIRISILQLTAVRLLTQYGGTVRQHRWQWINGDARWSHKEATKHGECDTNICVRGKDLEFLFYIKCFQQVCCHFPCCKFCTTLERENSAISSMSPNASASSRPAMKLDMLNDCHKFTFMAISIWKVWWYMETTIIPYYLKCVLSVWQAFRCVKVVQFTVKV